MEFPVLEEATLKFRLVICMKYMAVNIMKKRKIVAQKLKNCTNSLIRVRQNNLLK
jgi:hypothetical protein